MAVFLILNAAFVFSRKTTIISYMATIRILPLETSRRIAAGEVIDRPASALRELLDNSIDAEAHDISIFIAQGGIENISVVDDGFGMSEEDLALSIREHATSKIYEPDDILKAKTLGFRGEALASISAVARIEIATRQRGSSIGWHLSCEPLKEPKISPFACREGTRVTISGLFESFPARRQFLKRPQSEAFLCRSVFAERAIAHPRLTFHWNSSNNTETMLPGSQQTRILQCYVELAHVPILEATVESEDIRMHLVYADISEYRRDRKLLQIFINRRKVPEWGLLSLIEYEFSKYLPGGAHAIAFLFLEIDPSVADFNIHPAKKEVRLKNAAEIRNAVHEFISKELASRYSHDTRPLESTFAKNAEFEFSPGGGSPSGVFEAKNELPRYSASVLSQYNHPFSMPDAFSKIARHESAALPRYVGKGPGPFLLFELQESLFILDQHAAHERILYDQIISKQGDSQPLLVPYILEAHDNERYLEEARDKLEFVGFRIAHEKETWLVEAVPSCAVTRALEALVEWLSMPHSGGSPLDSIAAQLACKAAIKDGETLDPQTAQKLIEDALALVEPRCPHGRPIFLSVSKERLYFMFGRLVG